MNLSNAIINPIHLTENKHFELCNDSNEREFDYFNFEENQNVTFYEFKSFQ